MSFLAYTIIMASCVPLIYIMEGVDSELVATIIDVKRFFIWYSFFLTCRSNKIKNKKYHIVGTVPKKYHTVGTVPKNTTMSEQF
jgi:hypothetical protein